MLAETPPPVRTEALRTFLAERGLEALAHGPVIFEPEPLEGGRFQTARRYLPAHVAHLQCPALTKLGYRRRVVTAGGNFKVWLEPETDQTMKRFAERITSEEFTGAAS